MSKYLEALAKRIAKLSNDLKAEVVLTDLVEGGFSPDDLVVKPVGTAKRRYSRDIEKVSVIEGNFGRNFQLHVEINREGLYDTLPENLFHLPQQRNPNRSTSQMVEEIRRNRRVEKEIRKFFLPLEQEFFRQRLLVELEERKLLLDDNADAQSELFTKFWNFPKFLDGQQCFNLVFLLPVVHKLVGDWDATAICYAYILNQPVQIEVVPPRPQPVSDEAMPALVLGPDGPQLGINLVVGQVYTDTLPGLRITVGPLDKKSLPDFLPGGRLNKVIEYLNGYLLPCETEVETVIELEPEAQIFSLGLDDASGRLGYSTGL
ncbi:MAG: type VI secretion system baseplate subunit TssG [Bernardetiaceae bacterium]|jgi:hypothetical protein|nr:type VI secretion system baseplate subunit TssG [Bernardetiaceae bacterium]